MTASLKSWFSLDLRALALFRIGLSSAFVVDLLLRLQDLQMFYGDDGVLTRRNVLEQNWYLQEFQPFLSTGSTPGLVLLFLLGTAAGICLGIGYRTRYAGLFCWYFTVCLQLRNPAVLDGGDEFLRLLLFWSPFLPLSARWSVDANKNPQWQSLSNAYRSLSTAAIYVQFAVLYFFAAYLKTGDVWRKTGLAIYYALSIDQYSTRFGKWLLGFPDLLKHLTPAVLLCEFSIALLLLFPAGWVRFRYALLALAVAVHASFWLSFHFGIFMPVMILVWVVFLPTPLLNRLTKNPTEVPKTDPATITVSKLPPGYNLRPLENLFGAFIIFYILFVNVQSVTHHHRLPGWTMGVASVTFEHQHWHLFAPGPFLEDGWFVFEVTDREGKVWREFASKPCGVEKPADVATTFPNQRWRRWFQNLILDPFVDTQSWRNATAFYFANRWLREHPGQEIDSYRLLFFEEKTPPPGETPKVERIILAESVKN